MTFARITSSYTLGAGLSQHPVSPAIFGKAGGVFAPGMAKVVFGDPTARKWPEVIEPVGGCTLLYSERIADQLRTCKFVGLELYPVEVRRVESMHLEKKKPPIYFWARILGEMSAHIFKDGVEVFPNPNSGLVQFSVDDMAFSLRKIRLDPRAWDGSDFFRITNMYTGMRFCSQKVIEAAAKYKWPDIVFAKTNENLELNF